MYYRHIIVKRENGIYIITLNRPEKGNSLNLLTISELREAVELADKDHDIKILLLTGAGAKAFCTGRDLNEYATYTNTPINDFSLRISEKGLNFCFIEKLKKPIIAVINGYAFGGGCELALACDMRISSDTALFGFPEIDLDTFPGVGGTWLLPRIIGKSNALRMILTGETIGAQEALRMGLVDKVVSSDRLMEEAKKLASKIAEKNPQTIQMAKLAINHSSEIHIAGARAISIILRSLTESFCEPKVRISRFLKEKI